MNAGDFKTIFGSLDRFEKGKIQVINDDPRNFAFSNVFDVASRSAAYEKVVVGRNRQYVIEVLRAVGRSDWFVASHDEFALVMDGVIEIELVKPDSPERLTEPGSTGSVRLDDRPQGRRMGWMKLSRGHQALLPGGCAYRFAASDSTGLVVLQTIHGPDSVERWSEICAT